MMSQGINVTLKIWRQPNTKAHGEFKTYPMNSVSAHMSFLEMLDVLNEKLVAQGEEPVAFESDCREGICGTCGLFINGRAHGPLKAVATCQLHMRSFKEGDVIFVEPFRAKAFPILKDLVVDRRALDKIMQAGGYISVNTGSAAEANALPIPKPISEEAMDAAACIGCGACVATCKNASAMLFTAAKVSHLALLPQGQTEARTRVLAMVRAQDAEGFGHCSNTGACEVECPKAISLKHIARLNRELIKATFG
jgi:succinate dehydrogenase / fumarate reductase iron-sulfur subunit